MKECCDSSHEHQSIWRLAHHCTLRCLLGCGLGEVIGFIIATTFGWPPLLKIIFSVLLGFIFGFILATRPLMKQKFSFLKAAKIIFAAEFTSIAVMETAEVLAEIYIPGVMQAGLTDPIFWIGMMLALTAGYFAAFPVNYFLIRRGVRHHH